MTIIRNILTPAIDASTGTYAGILSERTFIVIFVGGAKHGVTYRGEPIECHASTNEIGEK